MSVPFSISVPRAAGACRRQACGCRQRGFAARQQHVPVQPAERQLPEVVQPRLPQQRQPDPAGEPPGKRLSVVVEVDEQRLARPAFYEAVGVPVERRVQRLAREVPGDVPRDDLALEVGHRACLGRGNVGGVADHEHVRPRLGLQGPLVREHEAELVAKAGRAFDIGLAAVQRDHDRQVERDLTAVVGDELPARAVYLAGVELRDDADAHVLEQPAELTVAHGLGERPVERRDVGQVDLVPDAALVEIRVGEEAELQRGDRALDRHVHHRNGPPAAIELGQRAPQRRRAVKRVEGEDPLHPARAGEAVGLLREQPGAGRDHQHVVWDGRPVGQQDLVPVQVDAVHSGLPEGDTRTELAVPRPDQAAGLGLPERHEQQARLVDVLVIGIDDDDLGGAAKHAAQPVGDQRPAGAAAQDHNPLAHDPRVRRVPGRV